MPETIAPATRINPMTTSRLAAEARAAEPVKLWQPAPPPPPHPAVVALREKAEAIRSDAAEIASRADSMTQAANAVGQKISALETERARFSQWLSSLEGINLAAQKENAETVFSNLYGRAVLDHYELESLKSAELFLVKFEMRKTRTPGLIKSLKAKIAAVTAELDKLESDGGR